MENLEIEKMGMRWDRLRFCVVGIVRKRKEERAGKREIDTGRERFYAFRTFVRWRSRR